MTRTISLVRRVDGTVQLADGSTWLKPPTPSVFAVVGSPSSSTICSRTDTSHRHTVVQVGWEARSRGWRSPLTRLASPPGHTGDQLAATRFRLLDSLAMKTVTALIRAVAAANSATRNSPFPAVVPATRVAAMSGANPPPSVEDSW